jgi:hypothetical protein
MSTEHEEDERLKGCTKSQIQAGSRRWSIK